MTKLHLTYSEKKEVERLLAPRLVILVPKSDSSPGFVRFIDGASDEHVTCEARSKGIRNCNPTHVRSIRSEAFGLLRERKANGHGYDEKLLNGALEGMLGALTDKRPPEIDTARIEDKLDALVLVVAKLTDDIKHIERFLTDKTGVDWSLRKAQV